jgi:isopentenyl-diphosphate delta-isomerase
MKTPKDDPNAAGRKQDHIELAFEARVNPHQIDNRFYFEPALSGHPQAGSIPTQEFLGKTFKIPLWVSSMTGGTAMARVINHNLARACGAFGMGMGLGSCRSLLGLKSLPEDFTVRHLVGDQQPLYANLGIAQVEQLIEDQKVSTIIEMVKRLEADGLIVHINPLQEWLQPEGDRYYTAPIITIQRLLDQVDFPIIVKEVGQGMGINSLKALLELPLAAVDFAANGGTNFALLELLRSDETARDTHRGLAQIGHSAEEMNLLLQQLITQGNFEPSCRQIIIYGGISNYLDGYYHLQQCPLPALYGQASAFLKYARGDYEVLEKYIAEQVRGLEMAYAFLKVKS